MTSPNPKVLFINFRITQTATFQNTTYGCLLKEKRKWLLIKREKKRICQLTNKRKEKLKKVNEKKINK